MLKETLYSTIDKVRRPDGIVRNEYSTELMLRLLVSTELLNSIKRSVVIHHVHNKQSPKYMP